MKILARHKFDPIYLCIGDSISIKWSDGSKGWFKKKDVTLTETKITSEQAMIVNEAVLFEDIFEGRRALGGLFVEKQ